MMVCGSERGGKEVSKRVTTIIPNRISVAIEVCASSGLWGSARGSSHLSLHKCGKGDTREWCKHMSNCEISQNTEINLREKVKTEAHLYLATFSPVRHNE